MKKKATPRYRLCKECGQPMLPNGEVKKPNEFDHASGCPLAKCPSCKKRRELMDTGLCATCQLVQVVEANRG